MPFIRYINEEKVKEGCKKCGENKFYILDFHHKNPNEKDFDVCDGVTLSSIEKIKTEIEKCVVLCSNCHREFHYLERTKNITIEQYLK